MYTHLQENAKFPKGCENGDHFLIITDYGSHMLPPLLTVYQSDMSVRLETGDCRKDTTDDGEIIKSALIRRIILE